MVREFCLLNEKGQRYSLMDIENYCLLTEPSGLGFSYSSEYEQIGNTFVETLRTLEQGEVLADFNFLYYDNYRNLVDFIETSEKLRLEYVLPYKSGTKKYYKDVNINSLSKTEKKDNGVMTEACVIKCLTLWYEEKQLVFDINNNNNINEIRWDFVWDSYFVGNADGKIDVINKGHIAAPIELEISGRVVNPYIVLYVDNEEVQRINFSTTINLYEKLLYGTKENEFYIKRKKVDGTTEDLFDLNVINFGDDNVLRIPRNKSCTIKIMAENEISEVKATIFIYYKAV